MLSHQTIEKPCLNSCQKSKIRNVAQVKCVVQGRKIDFCRKTRVLLTYPLIECIIVIQVSGMRHLARYWSQCCEILPPAGVGRTKWRIPFIQRADACRHWLFLFSVIKNTMENRKCQLQTWKVEKYSGNLCAARTGRGVLGNAAARRRGDCRCPPTGAKGG